MKFTEEEIKNYYETNKKFYEKCHDIFLVTVYKEERETAEFDSFEIYFNESVIFYKDFEGDLCEFCFPTNWLMMEIDDIPKEYEKLLEKQGGSRYI